MHVNAFLYVLRTYLYLEDSREIFWAFTTFPYKIIVKNSLLSQLETKHEDLRGLETSASPRFLNPQRSSCLVSNLYIDFNFPLVFS